MPCYLGDQAGGKLGRESRATGVVDLTSWIGLLKIYFLLTLFLTRGVEAEIYPAKCLS